MQAIEVVEEAREPGSQIQNLLGLRDLREGCVTSLPTAASARSSRSRRASGSLSAACWCCWPIRREGVRSGNGAGIAVLWTARGVGSFAGPFAAFRLAGTDERGLRRSISGAFALLAVCYVAFALSPRSDTRRWRWPSRTGAVASSGQRLDVVAAPGPGRRPRARRRRRDRGFMLTLSASTVATACSSTAAFPRAH